MTAALSVILTLNEDPLEEQLGVLVVSGTVRENPGLSPSGVGGAEDRPLTRKAGYAFPARMWNMPGSNTTLVVVGQGDKFEMEWDQARFPRLCSHRILTMMG